MSLDDGYLDHAIWVTNDHNGGGTYTEGSWKIVIHEIQGSANPAAIVNHPYPPQLWYRPDARVLYQTVPLTRSGFALEHYSGTPETNKSHAIQVEVAGYTTAVADEPIEWLDNIAEDVIIPICQFVSRQGGQIKLMQYSSDFFYPGSASEDSPNRMSWDEWTNFQGITGHAWVPSNSHYDPGAMNLARIATHAALTVGGIIANTPILSGERKDMTEVYFRRRPVPFNDPGVWGDNDDVYDHYHLPADAEIVVALASPDYPPFPIALYGPGIKREDVNQSVREVRWGVPGFYRTSQVGQYSVVVPAGAPVDVRATY